MPSGNWWRAALSADWQQGGFGIYVHWPFCAAKCPYCDFNSHVWAEVDQARWRDALVGEVARVAGEVPGRVVSTVFFGGGTPSLMPPETVGAVLEAVRTGWPVANDLEVTLEANPTSVEAGRFRGFADAGVNRVSVGLQALNDADLGRLGRLHSAAEGRAAYELAREVFPRVSFDLIYARQFQSLADWRAELREALAMEPEHLSLYQLTIEEGTAFGRLFEAGRLKGLPDEDLAADHYELTQEMCEAAGLPAYEVSNHAGDGAEARHNLIYWRSGDWAGIGPGAHGRLTVNGTRYATEAARAPGDWLRRAEAGSEETVRTALSDRERFVELLLMGLRVSDGVDLGRLQGFSGDVFQINIKGLESIGLIKRRDGRLRLTRQGRPVLNGVLRELIPDEAVQV
ncbi:radical SAM family heme chaperone HemW [Aestuariibius sp. 2305UL40-4]|uniref:radical SAM family heme chaperone HemW n=1 Tax=Aestuariibius violaceus TaxID=3234132 RepID=UPI00345F0EB3